jgi:hypothetical protein
LGKGGIDAANATQSADENALTQIAATQSQNSQALFNQSMPAFQQAQAHYENLASGNPYAISSAVSPIAQQADATATASTQNILQNGPAGGEKNLALDQVSVNRGATVGNAATQGYQGAFNALGQIGSQGIGLGQASAGQATQGYGSAGGMALQEQGLQVQQKGNTLSALSSLGGDAATLGAGFI